MLKPDNRQDGGIQPMELEAAIRNLQGNDDQANLEELVPLLYNELRRLANRNMARRSGHTYQATELVHEAWLRLSGSTQQNWTNRSHFIAVAAETMRWILVEQIRRKQSLKRGGGAEHKELDESTLIINTPSDEILAVHEALEGLAREDSLAAELVKLRYFVGMTMDEAAASLNLGKRTAEKLWTYARLWLRKEIQDRI